MNLAVLVGRLARPPEQRLLPSGDSLVAFEVTIPRLGERAETVPVVWFGAPARAVEYGVDDLVVVVGRVRRRFFRTGPTTQSRTEVVAENVLSARHGRRARNALSAAAERLASAPL